MTAFKFAHAADIHLGAPFSSFAARDGDAAQRLRNAVFDSWNRVVEVCIREKVAFLVLAGDVFDQETLGPAAVLRFRDTLLTLEKSGIRVYICHGNHDPLNAGNATFSWPSNVTVFPSGEVLRCRVESENGSTLAEIYGTSYGRAAETGSLLPLFPEHDSSTFALGVLHSSMGTDAGRHQPYSPVTPDELDAKRYDYWALGHVHTRQRVELKSGAPAVYPGNVQGLNGREPGPRGFEVVTVEEDRSLSAEFFETCAVRWFQAGVSLEGTGDIGSLQDKCLRELGEIESQLGNGQGAVVRLVIEGRGELHAQLNTVRAMQEFGEHLARSLDKFNAVIALEKIIDQTLPALDREKVIASSPFAAEILRQVDLLGNGQESSAVEIISELFDNPSARVWLEKPDTEQLKRVLESASVLIIDTFAE